MKAELIFMGMMQKKNQNGQLKKTEFFNSANSQYFFTNRQCTKRNLENFAIRN